MSIAVQSVYFLLALCSKRIILSRCLLLEVRQLSIYTFELSSHTFELMRCRLAVLIKCTDVRMQLCILAFQLFNLMCELPVLL